MVPQEMMPEATEYTLQNPEQFKILWGKVTHQVDALEVAVRAAEPLPESVPVAIVREVGTGDARTIAKKLVKTDEKNLQELDRRIKEDPNLSTEQKEEGSKYVQQVITINATKEDMVQYTKDVRKATTQDQLQVVLQQALGAYQQLVSVGLQMEGRVMAELQAQAGQLQVLGDQVQNLSGQVLQNSQWLGNGIRGLHAHQEQMGAATFQNFQHLYTGLNKNFQQNLDVLDELKKSVLSTKADQEVVQTQLAELKEQAGQLVLQKDEQVGVLSGVLDQLKSQTEEMSKAVQGGSELRAGLGEAIHQYLDQSKALEVRCQTMAAQRDQLERTVADLQEVAGELGAQAKAKAEEVQSLTQSWAQRGAELKQLGDRGLAELSKVLAGVGRLEQAVVAQGQNGAETRALVESLSQAVKKADLDRVAGLVAAQKQDRPDLTLMIPQIQAAVEAGLKSVPATGVDPVMTQDQVMDLIRVVTDRYDEGAAGQAQTLAGHLAEFGRLLDQVRAEVTQGRDQRGPQAFSMPIAVVQRVVAGLGQLQPMAVPPVVDYGRIQFMTPAERIRELRSLAAQPRRSSKTRGGHGRVSLKSKLVDPALDEGRDVRRVTKAKRVARVKKIERRRTRDPLDLYLQGKYE